MNTADDIETQISKLRQSIGPGQIFRALVDIPTQCGTLWKAPYVGEREVVFPRGESFIIDYEGQQGTGVWCRPSRYEDLERLFIPLEHRTHSKWDGYSVWMSWIDIISHCEQAGCVEIDQT